MHLVLFEQRFQQSISMYVEGEELSVFAATVSSRVRALLVRFLSRRDLVAEVDGCRAETVSPLRGLLGSFAARPEYVRMGQIMIGEEIYSTIHRVQTRRMIAAVRS